MTIDKFLPLISNDQQYEASQKHTLIFGIGAVLSFTAAVVSMCLNAKVMPLFCFISTFACSSIAGVEGRRCQIYSFNAKIKKEKEKKETEIGNALMNQLNRMNKKNV